MYLYYIFILHYNHYALCTWHGHTHFCCCLWCKPNGRRRQWRRKSNCHVLVNDKVKIKINQPLSIHCRRWPQSAYFSYWCSAYWFFSSSWSIVIWTCIWTISTSKHGSSCEMNFHIERRGHFRPNDKAFYFYFF